MRKKVFGILVTVVLLAAVIVPAFASETEPWTGEPDPYACNSYQDCFWTVVVCIEGATYEVGIYYDPTTQTAEYMEEDALNWSDIVLTMGTCEPRGMNLIFDGLWAYKNDTWEESPNDVCYVISSKGLPSVERKTAICDNYWPGGPRPGWSENAVELTSGRVYYDGTDWGWWEGDFATENYSPNAKRLPLYDTDGGPSLFNKFCAHKAKIGEPVGWCK